MLVLPMCRFWIAFDTRRGYTHRRKSSSERLRVNCPISLHSWELSGGTNDFSYSHATDGHVGVFCAVLRLRSGTSKRSCSSIWHSDARRSTTQPGGDRLRTPVVRGSSCQRGCCYRERQVQIARQWWLDARCLQSLYLVNAGHETGFQRSRRSNGTGVPTGTVGSDSAKVQQGIGTSSDRKRR